MPIETVEASAWRHLDVARDAIDMERTRRVQALAPGESISFVDAPPPTLPMRRPQSAGSLADTVQSPTDTSATAVTTADANAGSSLAGVLDLSATGGNGGAQALLADSAHAATGVVQATVGTPLDSVQPTASAEELAIVDLMLANPLNVALIAAYSSEVRTLHGGISGVFIERYGEERAGRMAQLADATHIVRSKFATAVQREYDDPQSDSQWWRTWVEDGGRYQRPERHWDFDLAKFTKWYCEQPGLEHEAFAALYGDSVGSAGVQRSRGSERSVESYTVGADQFRIRISHEPITGSRQHYGWTDRVSYGFGRFIAFNPNDPPPLHDVQAVGFDPALGFITHGANLVVDESGTQAIAIVAGVMIGFATAGTATGIVASVTEATGSAALGAAAGGAFSGLVTSFATGAFTGNLSFKSLLIGALTGAAAAGIAQAANLNTAGLDAAGNVVNYGARVLAITGKATLQGALADLAGGKFLEGFTSGIASGFAGEITRGLNQQIAAALKSHQITDGQASLLRTLAQATGSAISSLANPGEAGYAIARDFLNTMLSEAGSGQTGGTTSLPTWKPIFDDDGNLMPGIVDVDAPLEVQEAQLQARLSQEGFNPQQAQGLARETFAVAVVLRDELARQEQLSAAHDRARAGIDQFEPGSSADPLAAREEGYPQRLGKLQSNLQTLTEANTPFLIDRHRNFVKVQIEKYTSLEAAAVGSGDTSLARAYRDERSLFEGTLTRLDQRLVEVDYHTALQRYGNRLAERPSRFSAQEINQSLMRFANGQSRSDSAIDNYVRANLAGDDPKLYVTALGGGNIATLAGQDGHGGPTTVRTGVNAYSASLRGSDAAANVQSGAGVKVVIGPWREGATNIVEGGTFTQCADGSCVSATGQRLSGGSLTERQLLSRLGEWSNPNALATELNRSNPSANWKSGYFGSEADALVVANRGQVGVVLQAPGAPAHMVTMEPIAGSPGMFRVYDTGAGATYDVTSAWVKRFVAGGVWR